jgi:hypothetical protein
LLATREVLPPQQHKLLDSEPEPETAPVAEGAGAAKLIAMFGPKAGAGAGLNAAMFAGKLRVRVRHRFAVNASYARMVRF